MSKVTILVLLPLFFFVDARRLNNRVVQGSDAIITKPKVRSRECQKLVPKEAGQRDGPLDWRAQRKKCDQGKCKREAQEFNSMQEAMFKQLESIPHGAKEFAMFNRRWPNEDVRKVVKNFLEDDPDKLLRNRLAYTKCILQCQEKMNVDYLRGLGDELGDCAKELEDYAQEICVAMGESKEYCGLVNLERDNLHTIYHKVGNESVHCNAIEICNSQEAQEVEEKLDRELHALKEDEKPVRAQVFKQLLKDWNPVTDERLEAADAKAKDLRKATGEGLEAANAKVHDLKKMVYPWLETKKAWFLGGGTKEDEDDAEAQTQ